MASESIDDLIKECGTEPFTKEDFLEEKAKLEVLFKEQYGIDGEEKINEAIRYSLNCGDELVEDWVALMVWKPYIL